ncbi:unnamed protein product [Ectocarpus sp. 13 AM-2016]
MREVHRILQQDSLRYIRAGDMPPRTTFESLGSSCARTHPTIMTFPYHGDDTSIVELSTLRGECSYVRLVVFSRGVLTKFKWASTLLWWLLGVVGVESVVMACMGSVSFPTSAVHSSQQSESYQACEASSRRETRRISREKAALRPFVRSSGGRSLGGGGRRAMLALVSAVRVDLVEGKWLIEFPPGVRCTWNDLPHGLQFAILFLMLGILYGVNRLFDKADEAMYTRLSSATAGLLRERRRQHAPHVL